VANRSCRVAKRATPSSAKDDKHEATSHLVPTAQAGQKKLILTVPRWTIA